MRREFQGRTSRPWVSRAGGDDAGPCLVAVKERVGAQWAFAGVLLVALGPLWLSLTPAPSRGARHLA